VEIDHLARPRAGADAIADPTREFHGSGRVRPIDDDERALAERNTGDDRLDEKVGKDRCGNRRIVVGHSTILPGAALVSLHRH